MIPEQRVMAVMAYLINTGATDARTIEKAVLAAKDLPLGAVVSDCGLEDEQVTRKGNPMLRAFVMEQASLLLR